MLFEFNQCESFADCTGVLTLSSCEAVMVDVTFSDNDISPASGTVRGGLIYATYSGITSTGLLVDNNSVVASTTLHGGFLYAAYGTSTLSFTDTTITNNTFDGTTVTGGAIALNSETTAPDFDYLYMSNNTVPASGGTVNGGLIYLVGTSGTYTWMDVRENSVTAATIYGGLVEVQYVARPTFRQLIAADNTVYATGSMTGGLFFSGAYVVASPADYSVGSILFGDIVGNTITGGNVYGGVLAGDYAYYSASSTASDHSSAWDMEMVNVVDNTVSGTVSGSVYYDDSSSYDYNMDWDYCNIYNNSGTDFYYATDPTGTSGNVAVDPLYTDVSLANGVYWDLTLRSTSTVRNAGNPASTYNDGDGTYAAIGAYGGPYGDDW